MTAVRGVNRSQAKIQADKVRKALVAPGPLRKSSLTEPGDQIRIGANGAGGFLNADGSIDWAGLLRFVGTLTQTGPSTFEGPVSVTGATGTLDVEADATFGGDTKIGQNLEVTAETLLNGIVTLLKDLNVLGGGKINVGTAMTFDPSVSSGAVVFSNGAQVFTDSSTIQVYKGNGVVQISDSEAKLQLGGSVVRCDTTGVTVTGPTGFTSRVTFDGQVFAPTLSVSSRPDLAANVVVWNPGTGRIERTI